MAEPSARATAMRPRVIEAGVPALDPGLERHRVQGGGAIVVAIELRDVIEIADLEGRQTAELVLFAPNGNDDSGAIGLAGC